MSAAMSAVTSAKTSARTSTATTIDNLRLLNTLSSLSRRILTYTLSSAKSFANSTNCSANSISYFNCCTTSYPDCCTASYPNRCLYCPNRCLCYPSWSLILQLQPIAMVKKAATAVAIYIYIT